MTVRVAVDLGTSSTCTAVAVDDEAPRLVVVDGAPLMPSAVCLQGAVVLVGADAERRAALDPACFEQHPRRRIDEGSLLLGTQVLRVVDALAAVLARAVGEARAVLGGAPVDELVLTHPAGWGSVRTGVLRAAATGLAARTVLVPEPVAAAVLHGWGGAQGAGVLAVLDVGAGTTDVTVLRPRGGGFQVLATRGEDTFGGADVDQALLEHVGAGLPEALRSTWDAVVHGRDLQARRHRRVLVADVRGAKESLSRRSWVDVPLPAGLPDAHLTRDDLEALVGHRVRAVVELLAAALHDAGAVDHRGRTTATVVLVGGSSRIPLVARQVQARLQVAAVSTDQPETVVARGALLAVRPLPRPAGTAPSSPPAARSRRPRVLLAVGAAIAVAGGLAAVVVQRSGAGAEPEPVTVRAQHASVVVPAGWREVERSEEGTTSRLVLSAPDGDHRLLLVQTELTPGASARDVASALAEQVGSASGRYDSFDAAAERGGRAVLAYRERTGDGSVVEWSVVVDGGFQLSVGCQGPEPADDRAGESCAAAVASVRAEGS